MIHSSKSEALIIFLDIKCFWAQKKICTQVVNVNLGKEIFHANILLQYSKISKEFGCHLHTLILIITLWIPLLQMTEVIL